MIIGGIGNWRGLGILEKLEKYAVALNLGMIGALLVGLAVYNVNLLIGGQWALPAVSSETNVNGIIAYASRAFAMFYMLQCVVAFLVAWQNRDLPRRPLRLAGFAIHAVICLLVFALGLPSE